MCGNEEQMIVIVVVKLRVLNAGFVVSCMLALIASILLQLLCYSV